MSRGRGPAPKAEIKKPDEAPEVALLSTKEEAKEAMRLGKPLQTEDGDLAAWLQSQGCKFLDKKRIMRSGSGYGLYTFAPPAKEEE